MAVELGAQFMTKNYRGEQGKSDYQLYIPASYQQDSPLVIMLHGCTQSADDFAAGTCMNALAEQHQCLVAYPEQSASANPNRCWNWFRPADQQAGEGEPALLAGITAEILQDYTVDPTRVYIAGLSAGASMAIIMAETYPEYYAALGVHSGLAYRSANDVSSAFMAMQKGSQSAHRLSDQSKQFVPAIVFHGEEDKTVVKRNGEQVFEQLKQPLEAHNTAIDSVQDQPESAQGRRSTRTRLSDTEGKVQLEYWLVHGAGHAWAGGSDRGSHTDPSGPNASAEMLRFFLSHQR